MYYQSALGYDQTVSSSPRVRIIYPNGKAEWLWLYSSWHVRWRTPCWMSLPVNSKRRTAQHSLKKMRAYDKRIGFPKAKFLGEI